MGGCNSELDRSVITNLHNIMHIRCTQALYISGSGSGSFTVVAYGAAVAHVSFRK